MFIHFRHSSTRTDSISYHISYTTEFTTSGIDEESLQIKSEATVRQKWVFQIATFICHTAEKEQAFSFNCAHINKLLIGHWLLLSSLQAAHASFLVTLQSCSLTPVDWQFPQQEQASYLFMYLFLMEKCVGSFLRITKIFEFGCFLSSVHWHVHGPSGVALISTRREPMHHVWAQ